MTPLVLSNGPVSKTVCPYLNVPPVLVTVRLLLPQTFPKFPPLSCISLPSTGLHPVVLQFPRPPTLVKVNPIVLMPSYLKLSRSAHSLRIPLISLRHPCTRAPRLPLPVTRPVIPEQQVLLPNWVTVPLVVRPLIEVLGATN